jgi:hypothetical protein
MEFQDFNTYDSHCAILTSDRLIFNSKVDNIFLISNKDIGLSANGSVHINIGISGKGDEKTNYFVLNSPNIQFGMPENGTNEHVAKAESVIKFISKITSVLDNFSDQLAAAQAFGMGVSTIPSVKAAADYLKKELKIISEDYGSETSPIKSIITKTI